MGSLVKSDNTHNHQHTPISPYTWHLRLDLQYFRPCYSLSQPHHVMASHPSPGDNHWWRETHSVTKVLGLSTLFNLLCIVGQPPLSFLCCPRAKATFMPSIQPNLSLPHTHHQHPSGHTILIHSSSLLAKPLSIPALLHSNPHKPGWHLLPFDYTPLQPPTQ